MRNLLGGFDSHALPPFYSLSSSFYRFFIPDFPPDFPQSPPDQANFIQQDLIKPPCEKAAFIFAGCPLLKRLDVLFHRTSIQFGTASYFLIGAMTQIEEMTVLCQKGLSIHSACFNFH